MVLTQEYYERVGKEALRATLEEQALEQEQYLARIRVDQEWEDRLD